MSSITTGLARVSGPVALLLIAALVSGETAVFLGFVIPGETAAVLGGVPASRGRVSLPLLIVVVVAAALTGPLAGYEIGRHLGGRLIAARGMRAVAGGMDRAQAVLRRRGGLAVLLRRFVAVLRALMPAVAGTTRMPTARSCSTTRSAGSSGASGTACLATRLAPRTRRSSARSAPAWRSCWRSWPCRLR